jgi:uncharacterized phage-associated protein
MYDARQVANCILDISDEERVQVTHLALQKIVYFCHGTSYARFGKPLLLNKIEAWKNGPVIRELYFSFNSFGDRPISGRAEMINFHTRRPEKIGYSFTQDILDHVRETFKIYGPIDPWRLVAMTHKEGSPWKQAIDRAQKVANAGMRIEESLIQDFFSRKAAKN